MRRGKQSEEDDDKLVSHMHYIIHTHTLVDLSIDCTLILQLDSLGHYTVYVLEGRGGEVRWHLTPKDFQFNPAYSPVCYL